jgi:hypothetical protein
MWLCTQHGFFSIVEKKPGEYHVRARVKRDLENLQALMKGSRFELREVESWPGADYPHRIITSQLGVEAVMTAMVDKLHYSNFKSRIAELPDQRAKSQWYGQVWSEGRWYQTNEEREAKADTIEGQAEKLVYTSVDDLRSSLKCNDGRMDPNVLVAALHLARETKGKATHAKLLQSAVNKLPDRVCRKCGCTEEDCTGCIERTGRQCHWVAWDLCSACEE